MKIWRSSVHELRCQYRKSFSLCTHSSQLCKSAPRSRQITTPVSHHSVFYRPDALPAAQPTASKHRRHSAFLYYVYWCAFTLQPNSDFGDNNRLRTLKPQFHCAFSHDFCAGFLPQFSYSLIDVALYVVSVLRSCKNSWTNPEPLCPVDQMNHVLNGGKISQSNGTCETVLAHTVHNNSSHFCAIQHNNNNNHRFTAIIQVNLQLRTRGFCWGKVLLPTCPCWHQPAHSD